MFDYLLDKIAAAPFEDAPFRHLEIADFLHPDHFDAIVRAPQINLTAARSTEELLGQLADAGYEIIPFPGCVTSAQEYLDWYNGKSRRSVHAQTEGFGIVLRLARFENEVISGLDRFFCSDALKDLLTAKFGISRPVDVDAGLQKYLHGYEISPHPDVRRKALTWMLNINPGHNAEQAAYHTQYLKLRDEWRFISTFWEHNREYEREWLPWDWCETVKTQPRNNSIIFFAPASDTIHAVKAQYDHLTTQRTQFYGNYWYEREALKPLDSRLFDFTRPFTLDKLKAGYQSTGLKDLVRSLRGRGPGGPGVRKVDVR